ncbi:MAG: AlwI family type II restriction endonuclease [Chloroflexota bacterium]
MAVSRTWYVSCSPRSPEKIGPELTELAKLDGVNWRMTDQDGRKVHQIAFARFLKQIETFEGSISESDPAFSARDRLAPMQTYGFAFVGSNGRLRITPAGHRLIAEERPQELFLKQLLKWQYPSWQHGGNPRTRHLYPPAGQTDIFPFIETLRVCRELGGISKTEIAIFLLPVFSRADIPKAITQIGDFRTEREKFHGRERAEFVVEAHKQHFRQVYAQEIARGEVNTRETPTQTADQFLEKKIRNSRDVADAAIRYFRATGLFTLSADFHGLAISSVYRYEVDRILDELSLRPVEFYEDSDTPPRRGGSGSVSGMERLASDQFARRFSGSTPKFYAG